ncbi:GA module-containing protein, partial [Bacillus mycoides]|uniref:GA module-containing protein n=1 Tax=Bacillus mycoides TaxID=1405 RepID=UPI00382CC270
DTEFLINYFNDENNVGKTLEFEIMLKSSGYVSESLFVKKTIGSSLELTKEEAKPHIESLPNLTETEKEAFKKDVDSAKDKQQVKDIRDKADAKDAEYKAKALELKTAKKEAKQHIDSLWLLTKTETEAFKKDVDSAEDKQQVKDIRDKADAKVLEFKTAKEEAEQHIDSLSHLMEVQRQDFKRKVAYAKDKQQVKDIRDKADAKDAENKTKNLAEGILGKTEAIQGFHIGSSKLVFLINKKEDVEIERIIVRLPLSEDYETLWIPYTTEKRQKYRDVSMFTTLDNNYYTAPLDTEFLINFFNDENNAGKTLEFEIMLKSSGYVSESLFVKKTIGSSLELTKEEAK